MMKVTLIRRYSTRPLGPEGVFLAMSQEKQILLGQEELGRTLSRMAHEVVEKTTNPNELCSSAFVPAAHLARRMARKIEALIKTIPPSASSTLVSIEMTERMT